MRDQLALNLEAQNCILTIIKVVALMVINQSYGLAVVLLVALLRFGELSIYEMYGDPSWSSAGRAAAARSQTTS